MASKYEVYDYLTNKFKHEKLGQLVIRIDVALPDQRTQSVYLGFSEEELQITSPVAYQEQTSPTEVLEMNKSMFGIVTVNGAYALKHNVLIADIDESEVDNGIFALAHHADILERQLGKDQF